MKLLLSIFIALACTVASSALVAQPVSFTAGPGGMVVEPTIPKVMDQAAGRTRMLVNLLRVIDLQGNGRFDILLVPGVNSVQPWINAPMRLLRPSGAGAFTDVTRQYFGNGALPSTGAAPDIAIGDFNRDGKPDLFVAESGFDGEPFPGAMNLLVESTATASSTSMSERVEVQIPWRGRICSWGRQMAPSIESRRRSPRGLPIA
jgi:hypothetical protein